MKHRHSLSTIAFAAALAACDSFAPPVAPEPVDAAPPPEAQRSHWTSDDELARIARDEVPGFAGYYLEDDGSVVMRLVDPAQGQRAHDRFSDEFAHVRRGRMRFAANRTIVRPATYDFAQLKGWHDALVPLLRRDDVYLIDVDEVRNRVHVGVGDADAIAAVRREATRFGIPAAALHVETQGRPETRQTVQNWANPLVGGIQIAFQQSVCTLGFHARRVSTAQDIFVTNSHCTVANFAYDGGTIYQHLNVPGNAVGVEVADIGGTRYADAAYIAHNGTRMIARGKVARTLWSGIVILGDYSIVARHTGPVPVGMWLDKTGRTSGSTYGQVIHSCVTIGLLLCQDVSSLESRGGDSGAPVLLWMGDTITYDAHLVGIMWGGPQSNYQVTYSSRLVGIEADLGALTNLCVPTAVPAC